MCSCYLQHLKLPQKKITKFKGQLCRFFLITWVVLFVFAKMISYLFIRKSTWQTVYIFHWGNNHVTIKCKQGVAIFSMEVGAECIFNDYSHSDIHTILEFYLYQQALLYSITYPVYAPIGAVVLDCKDISKCDPFSSFKYLI